MAFHWPTFRTRALSAVVFVVIMAAGLLWNEWSFLILFSVIHFGCWIEYHRLTRPFHRSAPFNTAVWLFYAMLIGWGLMLYCTGDHFPLAGTTLRTVGLYTMRTVLIVALVHSLLDWKKLDPKLLLYFFTGLFYISLSLALLIGLRTNTRYAQPDYAVTVPLLIILNNWINDTMAYIVGSLIGKTPLSPISPKKTWEGTIGGLVLAVATISLIAHFTGLLPVHHAAALSAIGAITGTYGDLFESKLKRRAGVKDSGNMMPGHGGFLDRFDSLLFSATAGAIYVALFMK